MWIWNEKCKRQGELSVKGRSQSILYRGVPCPVIS